MLLTHPNHKTDRKESEKSLCRRVFAQRQEISTERSKNEAKTPREKLATELGKEKD